MSYFAFLSCQDFYISCEQLFSPNLQGKPLVILSNNEGGVIARSKEAAELNIPMGAPYSEIKEFCSFNQVKILSSNYKLYADLSQRIMDILIEIGAEIDIYSMETAFIKFPEEISADTAEALCREIIQKIKKWIGLSSIIGLAPTKTLAKIAHQKAIGTGLVSLCCSYERQSVLEIFPIENIRGITKLSHEKLLKLNVKTVQQFCNLESDVIRQHFGVIAEKLLWELRGLSCLNSHEISDSKEVIIFAHSFNPKMVEINELSEVLFAYTQTACMQLKQQKRLAQGICIFLESISDIKKCRFYSHATTLPEATNEMNFILAQAQNCLQKSYQKKEAYKKCGVILVDLVEENSALKSFLPPCPKRFRFMNAMHSIDEYFEKDAVHVSLKGTRNEWKTRSDKRSGQYVNRWSGLAFVKA